MIQSFSLAMPTEPAEPTFRLSSMSESDLIDLRGQIDEHLHLELKDVNLSIELSLQFKQSKALYKEVVDDDEAAPNQKAQVLNTITSILATITKAQTELFNAERLKKLEVAVLKSLKTLPKAEQEAFFDLYSEYLEAKDSV